MIVLAVGMPRAGSGWHYNLIHDLIVANGGKESRKVREEYHLQGILTEVNCNISALTPRRVYKVLIPAREGETFVVKAHSGPTLVGDIAMRTGLIKAIYIYRDPRDALLSAMDFGRRTLEKGHPNAFSHLTSVDLAVDFMLEYCKVWSAWMAKKDVLHARYEDLLTSYDLESQRLLEYLKIDQSNLAVAAIVDKYRPGQTRDAKDGTHFFKGQIGRFREKFTVEEQQMMAEKFRPYLKRMGYSE